MVFQTTSSQQRTSLHPVLAIHLLLGDLPTLCRKAVQPAEGMILNDVASEVLQAQRLVSIYRLKRHDNPPENVFLSMF